MIRAKVKRITHTKLPKRIAGHSKVKTGFPKSKSSEEVVFKAIYNHWGTSRGIPSRPFITNAIRNNKKAYHSFMEKNASSILKGEESIGLVVSQLGIMAQGYIQVEITDLKNPPNAPSTIRKKGSSNPLINTGEMRQAVTWQTYD